MNVLARVVNAITSVIVALLSVRLILRLLGANPDAGFTEFIYGLTAPLLAPFRGIFPTATVEGATLEWSTLIALIVYGVVGYLIANALYEPRRRDVIVERRIE